ncbi:MAG: uroporphyrinogen-III synthase [Planctomyces sp.]|jgi:uroporphyrinogen-III synthase|nr:uroporphyrinogen-III synthase [Planctomyces sp.]
MSAMPLFCSFESRRAEEMSSLLGRQGATVISAPSMREVPIENNPQAVAAIRDIISGRFPLVILMTGVGTESLFEVARSQGLFEDLLVALGRVFLAIRGPKPATVLSKVGLKYQLKAPEPNTWRELLQALDTAGPDLAGTELAIQEYGLPNHRLYAALQERGATVVPVPVYRWAFPEDPEPLYAALRQVSAGSVDGLLFTSANQVSNVLQAAQQLGLEQGLRQAVERGMLIASIGPTCTEALQDQGFPVHAEASPPKMGQLARAAVEAWRQRNTGTGTISG